MNIKKFIKSHLNIKGYSIENIEIKNINQKNDFSNLSRSFMYQAGGN